MKYLIQPLNEGQELNYSEIKEFYSKQEARRYAKNMCELLKKALPEGTISVEYEKYKNN